MFRMNQEFAFATCVLGLIAGVLLFVLLVTNYARVSDRDYHSQCHITAELNRGASLQGYVCPAATP